MFYAYLKAVLTAFLIARAALATISYLLSWAVEEKNNVGSNRNCTF
jgi:hypothetical protein